MKWSEPTVGARFAHRPRPKDPLAEVEILKLGMKRRQHQRISVRWVDESFEGQRDWVPATQLKCSWRDRGDFLTWERNWAAIIPNLRGSDEIWAAELVFEVLVETGVGWVETDKRAGVTKIFDTEAFAALLGVDLEFFDDPLSFVDDDALIVSWSTTERICRRLTEVHTDDVLQMVTNNYVPAVHPQDKGWEDDAYELVLDWCGRKARSVTDDVVALRNELARVRQIAENAIQLFRDSESLPKAARTRDANTLQRQLSGDADDRPAIERVKLGRWKAGYGPRHSPRFPALRYDGTD
ncbi:hypothetical protein [Rhodococcus erythropolis]|uniref:hypothetical protein n=1 Tax=Rhodococcus erythropolis TaxID=1833 RepID=UPI001BEC2A5F|nr:hypothetical protein [Rhodococcus erythropolis]MBT2266344.1 hypothetical protein [Rhodococcus erythropolis]